MVHNKLDVNFYVGLRIDFQKMGCVSKTPRRQPRRFSADPNKKDAQYMCAYACNMPGDGLFILVGMSIVPNLVVKSILCKPRQVVYIISYTALMHIIPVIIEQLSANILENIQ